MLQRADSMCGRRLAREFEGGVRSHDPVHRSRMRDAFLARSPRRPRRAPVATGRRLRRPRPRARARGARGARASRRSGTSHVFGDRPAIWDDAEVDEPTVRRRLRVGGWVDLTLRTDDGGHELRQFSLWSGRVPDEDPLELAALRVAFLRLTPWLDGAPLRLAWVDLVRGLVRERTVEPDERHRITEWFESRAWRWSTNGSRIRPPSRGTTAAAAASSPRAPSTATARTTAAGATCSRASCTSRRPASTPGVGAPANGATATCSASRPATAILVAVHGQQMHDVLRFVHEQGSCLDAAHVDDVLLAHGFDDNDRMRGELARHTERCPSPADALAHEMTRARFSHHPTTPFMATARLDALWVHDGLLDARDYKTGQVWSDRVADDAQARLQAWVLAPLAEAHGLQLRVAFEHLNADVVDDPEAFLPDADDLLAIESELRAEVTEIRNEVAVRGRRRPGRLPPLQLPFDLPRLRGRGRADLAGGRSGGRRMSASRGRMFWWGTTRRCPRCGSGHLFRRYFTMVDDCPRCGLHFEREQGTGRARWRSTSGSPPRCSSCVRRRARADGARHPGGAVARHPRPADDPGPDARVPVLEDDLGRGRPRVPPAPRPERSARRADRRGTTRRG